MTKLVVMGNFGMRMEIFMKENGPMIKPMGAELTCTQMAQDMMESGKTIFRMGKVVKSGLMARVTQELTRKA